MDKQAAFNHVYLAMKRQGFERSLDETAGGKSCRYRAENGYRCHIGHLMNDECYDPAFEGEPIYSFVEYVTVKLPEDIRAKFWKSLSHWGVQEPVDRFDCSTESDLHFLQELQAVHDRIKTNQDLKGSLILFAQNHGLTVPEE